MEQGAHSLLLCAQEGLWICLIESYCLFPFFLLLDPVLLSPLVALNSLL